MKVGQGATLGDVGAGTSLGDYELLLPVAQGGMAVVWAARLRGSGGFQKLVAVKTIRRALRFDSRVERMFLSEAKLTARIAHSNLCSVRELGEAPDGLYMAMEWIDGDTLSAVEEQMPEGLPVAAATRVAIDVGLGLAALHRTKDERGRSLGLVHCDVSPQNVLVTLDGNVKVVDFGLMRATAHRALPGERELLGGKMSFMAPEQADGLVDARTDVFALGLVLYRLVTGRHPFEGATALERYRNMRRGSAAPPIPATLRADCPVALSRAILRAIERKPAARFHSMAAFVRALRGAVPAVESAACRNELAVIARRAIGRTVLDRRLSIEAAIRAADASRLSWPPPEPEPISLPSSVLEELEPAPAPETLRPVSVAAVAARPQRRKGVRVAGLAAAAVALVGATLFTVSSMTEVRAMPQPAAAAFGAPPSAKIPGNGARSREKARATGPARSAAPLPVVEQPARRLPSPVSSRRPEPSAKPASDWRFDPGF